MIQRAFLKWLEDNRARFAGEIKLGRRADSGLEFSFAGINSAISGTLTTWEIIVTVTHEDECWDFLLSLDAEPKRVQGGYVCDLCPAQPAERAMNAQREGFRKPGPNSTLLLLESVEGRRSGGGRLILDHTASFLLGLPETRNHFVRLWSPMNCSAVY
jgi:hypothetical protein